MDVPKLCVVYIVISFFYHEVDSNAQDRLNETNDLLSSTPAHYGNRLANDPESSPEPDHASKDPLTSQKEITAVLSTENDTQPTEIFHFETYSGSGSGDLWTNTVLPHHRDDHHHVHDTDHYTVAKLDFESVSFPFYVSLWLLSACLAKIGMYGILYF